MGAVDVLEKDGAVGRLPSARLVCSRPSFPMKKQTRKKQLFAAGGILKTLLCDVYRCQNPRVSAVDVEETDGAVARLPSACAWCRFLCFPMKNQTRQKQLFAY